jgi:outer membrane immunogenic protein
MSSNFSTKITRYLLELRGTALAIAAITAVTSVPAYAADLPQKAPTIQAPVAYDWTGFYLGAEFGYGWLADGETTLANTGINFAPGHVFNPVDMKGVLGGFYGGYNYQINRLLVGFDADYSFAKLTGTAVDVSPTTAAILQRSDVMNWISTATGRVGYANDNWLWFAKGGWAWAEFDTNHITLTPGGLLASVTVNPGTTALDGWTVGSGAEWKFLTHWSAKFEYDYVKFDQSSYTITAVNSTGSSTTTHSVASSLNMLKGGVGYRF